MKNERGVYGKGGSTYYLILVLDIDKTSDSRGDNHLTVKGNGKIIKLPTF